jgi:hypothetical protein
MAWTRAQLLAMADRLLPLTCAECHIIFTPTHARKRVYCSYKCAHRATARKYAATHYIPREQPKTYRKRVK